MAEPAGRGYAKRNAAGLNSWNCHIEPRPPRCGGCVSRVVLSCWDSSRYSRATVKSAHDLAARLLSRVQRLRPSVLDDHLLGKTERPHLTGRSRFLVEFFYFGVKQARACLFVALFFAAVFTVPHGGCGVSLATTSCSSLPLAFKPGWFGPISKPSMNSRRLRSST